MNTFMIVFISVFLAELGDKTQLATLLFASDEDRPKILVFAAASAALVLSTAVAVLAGATAERYLAALPLKLIAGLGFIAIGAVLTFEHFRAV